MVRPPVANDEEGLKKPAKWKSQWKKVQEVEGLNDEGGSGTFHRDLQETSLKV